jgi:hypothetical protein
MPALSLVDGVSAEYQVLEGKPIIVVKSKDHIKHKSIQYGECVHAFRWVSTGKSQSWQSEVTIRNAVPAAFEETVASDGSQQLTITMGGMAPAAGIVKERMVGQLRVPGVHIDVPWGRDVWLSLFRSPWFPLKAQLSRGQLSLTHETSTAAASIVDQGDGRLVFTLQVSGQDFKKASLIMKRDVGFGFSEEPIGEVVSGTGAFEWRPILREFDLLLVTHGSFSMNQLADLIQGFGGQVNKGMLSGDSVPGDFVLCDGPSVDFTVELRGDRGFLEHPSDQAELKLSW